MQLADRNRNRNIITLRLHVCRTSRLKSKLHLRFSFRFTYKIRNSRHYWLTNEATCFYFQRWKQVRAIIFSISKCFANFDDTMLHSDIIRLIKFNKIRALAVDNSPSSLLDCITLPIGTCIAVPIQ